MPSQSQIRESVTQQILDALNEGTAPWRCPWKQDKNAGMPTNIVSQRRYSGVNPLLLEMSRIRKGFQSKWWATFRQFKKLGTHVRRGEKGTKIIFYKPLTVEKGKDGNGEPIEETIPLLRTFHVFNVEQVEGLDHLRVGEDAPTEEAEPEGFEDADTLIANSGADIRHGGNYAFYDRANDVIQMPHRHQFNGSSYYESLFHEMAHWSEHPSRLNWERSEAQNSYAMGELVAEMAACFVCTELSIPLAEGLDNHAAYLGNWLKALENDQKFIFKASTQASKVTDFLLAFKESPAEAREPAIII